MEFSEEHKKRFFEILEKLKEIKTIKETVKDLQKEEKPVKYLEEISKKLELIGKEIGASKNKVLSYNETTKFAQEVGEFIGRYYTDRKEEIDTMSDEKVKKVLHESLDEWLVEVGKAIGGHTKYPEEEDDDIVEEFGFKDEFKSLIASYGSETNLGNRLIKLSDIAAFEALLFYFKARLSYAVLIFFIGEIESLLK